MSARRSFIKHSLMAFAVSLLPKVLRPMDVEVKEEQEYFKGILWHVQNGGNVIYWGDCGSFCLDDMHNMFRDTRKQVL